MTPTSKRPPIECPDCLPEGNRFMEYLRTIRKRVPTLGPDIDEVTIAVYQCTRDPRHRREEGFE